MVMVRTELGDYLPFNEWVEHYKELLRQAGLTDDQIDFRVDLKKSEYGVENDEAVG